MLRNRLARWTLGAALVLLVPVGAVAQDPGVESSLERLAEASPDEMTSFARDAIMEMQGLVRSLAQIDEQIRKQDDDGLLCVTNNLAAARSLLQVSEAASRAMADANATGQSDRAHFEVRKIAIALKQARLLFAEGERCAYGEGVMDGKTRIQLEGSPTSSDSDETERNEDDVLSYGFDPPDASPF